MYNLNLDDAIKLYKSVGPRNADFLFPWLNEIYYKTYLSCIDIEYKDILSLDKTKLTIFDVLVDDLADNSLIRNRHLLEEVIKIPWTASTLYKNKYSDVARMIWQDCINSIKQYPRYDEFKDIFFFDLDQVMNSMRYSYLVNTADFSSIIEDEIYLNHGVMVILHCDMDLMCSSSFNFAELKKLRPIIHWVQEVAHLGNLLNTYPREIKEADFSSPIISMGLREGLIDRTTVIKDPEYALASIEPLVSRFEERMQKNLERIKENASTIYSIDIYDFYNRLKNVWNAFLLREAYWNKTQANIIESSPISKRIVQKEIRWVRM